MIDHTAALLACRALTATLSVATTGSTTLSATATGYARTTGSFITEGFKVGLETLPSGFTSNTARVITGVTTLALTVDATLTAQAAGAGRSLTVGQPQFRTYPNILFNLAQAAGFPFTEEEWLPGPSNVDTLGSLATITAEPIYVLKVAGLAGKGDQAVQAYVDKILTLYAPGTAITAGSDVLRVKKRPAPYASQITNPSSLPGRALVTVTVPLWAQTTSPI